MAKLLAALEEEVIATGVDTGVDASLASEPVVETADNVESALLDVSDAQGEVETLDENMDAGVAAASALEAFIIRLEEAQEEGGVDAAAAALMQIGVDAVMASVGAEPEDTQSEMPATEAYGSLSGRQRATAMAIESLKDQATKVWAAIKAAWDKFCAWVKNLWAAIRSGNERMRQRAEKLKAAANGLSGGDKDVEIEHAVLASLAVNGKFDAPVMDAEKVVKLLNETLDASNSTVQFVKSGVELMKAAAADGGAALDLGVLKGVKPVASAKKGENGAYVVAGLPGGYTLTQVIPDAVTPETLGKFSTSLTAGSKATGLKAKALKKGEIVALVDVVIKGLDLTKNAGEAEKNLDALGKEYSNALTALSKTDATGADDAAKAARKEGISQAKAVAGAVRKVMNQPSAAFAGYATNVFKHYLDLAGVSIAAQSKAA